MGDKNGDVSDDLDASLIAVFLKRFPFPEKLELHELLLQQVLGVRSCCLSPGCPGNAPICFFKRGEFRERIQPGFHLSAEFEKLTPERLRVLPEKSARGLSDKP